MFARVAIIGVGLIGGSIGMGLRARRLAGTVVGIGRHEARLRQAVDRGAVDTYTTEAGAGVRGADLVIVAVPVGSVLPVLRAVRPYLAPGTVVTDVGSCKAQIVAAAEDLLGPDVHFVGGHPMAGSEQTGIRGADRYLFEGAYYVLTPTPRTDPRALAVLRRLAEKLGCRVIEMDPAEHDRAVAAVSHLPHLLACALVNTIGGIPGSDRALALAAGGFRDTTRVAAGNPEIWQDIFLANREMVREVLGNFRAELDVIEKILVEGERTRLHAWLEKARRRREALPARMKGFVSDLCELVITISDRPGALAAVATTLGDHGVNIADVEILRVREGEGGSVRLGFTSEADRDRAADLLGAAGIPVVKR